jgi:predicted NBD/HSP70 family sugar kinase
MDLIFDMGGTRTRFAVVHNGKLDDIVRMDTDSSAGGFAALLGAMQVYVGDREVRSVVGGMPGQLEGKHGSLILAPNLQQWQGIPVRQLIERQFGCKAHIFNDVVLGGVGEANYGAGIATGVMAFFTVSTGVNGVRIVDGQPDQSIDRYELDRTIMVDSDGNLKDLESRVGGASLMKLTGKKPADIRDPQVWLEHARNLAVALYNTCLYWSPELIVLGGSMMRDIDLREVSSQMEALPRVLTAVPKLRKAKLGDTTGLHGALAVLKS